MPTAPAGVRPAGSGVSYPVADVVVASGAFFAFVFSFGTFVSTSPYGSYRTSAWGYREPLGWWTVLADMLLVASAVVAPWWPRAKEIVGFRRSHVQVGQRLPQSGSDPPFPRRARRCHGRAAER
jgi:hypothetical protein